MSRLRIAVVTQEDRLYIPENVELLCRDPVLDVREIVVLDTRGSLANMRGRLLRWFGLAACARAAARAGARAAADAVHRATAYRLPLGATSLRAVARRHGAAYSVQRDANAAPVLDRLRAHRLDAIVSYSAPQVFRAELLAMPRLGCINLHCGLLPHYRGLLPSFWVLLNGEEVSGATVHLMDERIDVGGILKQEAVDIRGMRTMHQVVKATKRRGGQLMLAALREMAAGTLRPMAQPADEGSYHGWPTDDDARRFRRKGNRLA